ncbi:MAG TPA: hypothetical protein VKT77_20260 [Chthonomonadaceae bacterium]|nr:hypothetical protein [Chthonomonadaceae bacterium]
MEIRSWKRAGLTGVLAATVLSNVLVGCDCGGSGTGGGALRTPRFAVSDLGANVTPFSINSAGDILAVQVDSSGNATYVVIQNGQPMPLGGNLQATSRINDNGQVVGDSSPDGTTFPGAIWMPGQYASPTIIGALPGDMVGQAIAINNGGTIVGDSAPTITGFDSVSHTVTVPSARPTIWRPGDTAPTEVLSLPGTAPNGKVIGELTGINSQGLAVGDAELQPTSPNQGKARFEYFTVDTSAANPTAQDLNLAGFLGTASTNTAGLADISVFVNNNGVIVAGTSGASPGAVTVTERQPGGQTATLNLGSLGGAVFPTGLNDAGQVTLKVVDPTSGSPTLAALYDPASGAADLNTQIPSSSGLRLVSTTGINNAGQIIGRALLNGQSHGYVLTPTASKATNAPSSSGHR